MPREVSSRSTFRRASLLALATVFIPLLLACRPAEVITRIPPDEASLKGLATIYVYAAADLGRPPRSIEELQPIFKKASIEDPTSMLSSTRDGQPYVIIWGLDLAGRYNGTDVPFAYEREGLDGVRLVINCSHQIEEVSEEDFAKLNWPEGHKPEL